MRRDEKEKPKVSLANSRRRSSTASRAGIRLTSPGGHGLTEQAFGIAAEYRIANLDRRGLERR